MRVSRAHRPRWLAAPRERLSRWRRPAATRAVRASGSQQRCRRPSSCSLQAPIATGRALAGARASRHATIARRRGASLHTRAANTACVRARARGLMKCHRAHDTPTRSAAQLPTRTRRRLGTRGEHRVCFAGAGAVCVGLLCATLSAARRRVLVSGVGVERRRLERERESGWRRGALHGVCVRLLPESPRLQSPAAERADTKPAAPRSNCSNGALQSRREAHRAARAPRSTRTAPHPKKHLASAPPCSRSRGALLLLLRHTRDGDAASPQRPNSHDALPLRQGGANAARSASSVRPQAL